MVAKEWGKHQHNISLRKPQAKQNLQQYIDGRKKHVEDIQNVSFFIFHCIPVTRHAD
jgi:hypothetical protein